MEHGKSVAGGQNEKVKISIPFCLLYDIRMNAIIMLKMMKPFSKNLSSLNQLGLRLAWKWTLCLSINPTHNMSFSRLEKILNNVHFHVLVLINIPSCHSPDKNNSSFWCLYLSLREGKNIAFLLLSTVFSLHCRNASSSKYYFPFSYGRAWFVTSEVRVYST